LAVLVNSKVSSPVNAGGLGGSTITISTTASTYSSLTVPSSYSITAGGTGYSNWGNITTSNGTTGSHPSLQVTGEANFDGDVKIKGVSIAKTLEDINKRLAILVPDPAKLEKFEALKKAYDHYKLLEALCHEEKKDD